MFFDAQTTEFTRDGKKQVFKGDVVAVGGGVLITADKISVDRNRHTLVADGHVILLTETQIFLGDRITYHFKSTDFLLINSVMVANDPVKAKEISQKVLGFTPAEVVYEEQKNKRLEYIEQRKIELREQYMRESASGEPSQDLVDQYALLLEQEDLTRSQENPFLLRMSKDMRRRFKARRRQWNRGIAELNKMKSKQRVSSFFRINGKVIERKNNNDYRAEEAFWTPCKCDDDESPAWGFQTSELAGQMEGYLDFYHPILEIKGIPVLYLPYLKLPIKEKRQSGFLPPTYGYRSGEGSIFAQPIFFAPREDLDSTLTTAFHERRGTKVGVEMRYQQKKYSGWTLQVEGIRDRRWQEDKKARRELTEFYFGGTDESAIAAECAKDGYGNKEGDPTKEAQCRRQVRRNLESPANDWRGSQSWNGLTILAPRLSFVSNGEVFSDHRYSQDLDLSEDEADALDPAGDADSFATAKYKLNLDAKNFYAGVGGAYGDSVLVRDRFQGQQLPFQTVMQSRLYSLDRGSLPVPIYIQGVGEHKQITDIKGKTDGIPQEEAINRTLGDGAWQRFQLSQTTPIVSRGVLKVDHFSDFEVRSIYHERLEDPHSTIRTWKTGVTVNLPIDGDAVLPDFFQDSGPNSFGSRHIRHYMNNFVTFSTRPEVDRRGPYGKFKHQYYDGKYLESESDLVYFASDRSEIVKNDDNLPREDLMIPHKRISFGTEHTWHTFNKGWTRQLGASKPEKKSENLSYNQRARKELLFSLDKPIKNLKSVYDETSGTWYVNRYKLEERDRTQIINFDVKTGFDFEQEKLRDEQKKEILKGEREDEGQAGLAEAWDRVISNFGVSLFSTTLSNRLEYNIYFKKILEQEFNLSLPRYGSTDISFKYQVSQQDPIYDADTLTTQFKRTTTFGTRIETSIVPHYMLSAWLARRFVENPDGTHERPQYESIVGAIYNSPSQCWRLGFVRKKEFGTEDERDALYTLTLTVIFMGRESRNDDVGTGLVRFLPGRS